MELPFGCWNSKIKIKKAISEQVMKLDVDKDDKIQTFYFIRNPEKLRHLQ